ncbi:MAG: EamA family transporter [Eubacteriales bacterium]|jgi:drug/metabolite transporter (DMT)-like permease|nr:EamA family transporter [Eubacteriales bacterium]
MKETTKGTLAMIATALLWSIGGIFIKLVPWNPLAIAGLRGLIGGLVMYAYLRLRGIKPVFNKDTVKIALALAGVCTTFVAANKMTTAANAIVIQYCAPVYVLLYIAFVQKKKLRPLDIAVVPITILGVSLCFIGQMGKGHLAGDIVAIISSMFFAAMFITSEGVSDQTRASGIMQGQFLTAIIGLPVLFATRPAFTAQAIGGILILGVFQIGLAYVLYSIAIKRAPLLTCSLLAVLEPLLNPVWVFLFAGENPGLWSLIGGVIVVAVITLWYVYNARHPAAQATAQTEPEPA